MIPASELIVIAPHPDDETIALGGTIHDHLGRRDAIMIVAVTDGEAADDQADERGRLVLVQTRIAERAAALEIIGASQVPIERLRYPDRAVNQNVAELEYDLRRILRRARNRSPACLLVLPWRGDPHPDHQACARAGIAAANHARVPFVEVPIWAWYEPRARATLGDRRIVELPLSEPARARKREALRCFKSQLELLPGGRGPVLPDGFLDAFDDRFEVMIA